MRIVKLRFGCLLAVAILALAAAWSNTAGAVTPSGGQSCYQYNLAPQYGSAGFICSNMMSFLDTTNTTLFPAGQPTPVSPVTPLPVTSTPAVNSPGSGATTPSYSKPAQSTYSRPAITSGSANTAQNVFTAGTIVTGCEFVNTGTAVIYVVIGAIATSTDEPIQVGQNYRCQSPTAQALSVFSASAWTIAGMVF